MKMTRNTENNVLIALRKLQRSLEVGDSALPASISCCPAVIGSSIGDVQPPFEPSVWPGNRGRQLSFPFEIAFAVGYSAAGKLERRSSAGCCAAATEYSSSMEIFASVYGPCERECASSWISGASTQQTTCRAC